MSKGLISGSRSIRTNNSEAAVAALVKVTMLGATEFNIAAAMTTEKRTLENYEHAHVLYIPAQRTVDSRKHRTDPIDLSTSYHSNSLPEGEAHSGKHDKVLACEEKTVKNILLPA